MTRQRRLCALLEKCEHVCDRSKEPTPMNASRSGWSVAESAKLLDMRAAGFGSTPVSLSHFAQMQVETVR